MKKNLYLYFSISLSSVNFLVLLQKYIYGKIVVQIAVYFGFIIITVLILIETVTIKQKMIMKFAEQLLH